MSKLFKEAVIVSAVRTPIGKIGGIFSEINAYALGSIAIKEALRRSGINPETINDVYMGNLVALPGNVARVAALEAGLPFSVPAMTIDRQCGSGLDAINLAASKVMLGVGEVYIAGGTENMTKAPYYLEKARKAYDIYPPKFLSPQLAPPSIGDPSMGETAEIISECYNITREEQDLFALLSQQKTQKAIEMGKFDKEIVPVETTDKGKCKIVYSKDESPRFDTNLEKLSQLSAVFKKGGTVTAGNSCPMNDGASAVVIMSKEKAQEMNLEWMAKVKGFTVTGLDPKVMGLGPLYAVKKLLKEQRMSLDEIGLIELNEAFAAQALACIKELKLDADKVNVNGGAIALGHPLGATGAILTTKILSEMKRRNEKYGIVTMCIGGGQGIATLLERDI